MPDEDLCSLVEDCLKFNPMERIDKVSIVKHPAFRVFYPEEKPQLLVKPSQIRGDGDGGNKKYIKFISEMGLHLSIHHCESPRKGAMRGGVPVPSNL